MNCEILKNACKDFRREEGRASFYDVALEIVDDHPLQASIVLLAVWNISRFRFMASDSENLVHLKKAMNECEPLFKKLEGETFRKANFDDIGDTVKQIYTILSKVKGVEYTGTSKVMHLLNRELFVMWDTDIRKEYGVSTDSTDYLDFQKKMQEKFKDTKWDMPNKSFAKAIDEYNQVTITIPKMAERKKRKQRKK
jgi:hypothetical protein